MIRSTTREVLLDVVVRDAHGHLVKDLKPGDVTVFENGIPQEVRSFRLVAGSEVRAEDAKQAAEVEPSRAAPPLPFNPLRTVNVVCLILNDLNPETRAFAFSSARTFVNEELRPNTFIGVFSLDASGLRPVFPFSNNRASLLKAVELAAVNQLPSLNMSAAAMFNGIGMSATGSVVQSAGSTGFADGANPQDPLGLRGDMGLSTNAGLREIDALIGLVRQLTPLPFQKTVLLLGTGLTRPADLTAYWDSLIHRAVSGGVTFYAMDVYGLGVCQGDTNPDCVAHSAMAPASAMLPYVADLSASQGGGTSAQSQAAVAQSTRGGAAAAAAGAASAQGPANTTATAKMAEMSHEDDYLKFMVSSANRQEAIRELAERTGGFLIANTNNTGKLLAHVMEEVDTHYEIAYAPASGHEDGRFRNIEVKLARPGLRVETRSGYFAVPETGEGPLTAEEMAALKTLHRQPRPHDFDFLVHAYRFRPSGAAAQFAIAFELPLANLTAAPPDAANQRRLHASLLALVKDAQGEIVARVSKDVLSDVAGDRLAAVQAESMTYEHAVDLPPGNYTVDAVVVDEEGDRAGTASIGFENRAQSGLALSDISLVRQVSHLDRPPDAADPFEYSGKRVLPLLQTVLPAGTPPHLYAVLYPQTSGHTTPQVRVQLSKDGRTISDTTPAVPPIDASGAIPIVIAADSKPGSYRMQVTASQDGTSAESMLAYTVEGTPAAPAVIPAAVDSGDRLAAFQRRIRTDLGSIPNYTCLETIDRSRRAGLPEFQPVDKIQLEVSSVGGKEMFARPGAKSFDNKNVTSLVNNGLIGSGMFSSLARNLFVEGKGSFQYKGRETVDGRATLRYTFRLSQKESGFQVQVNNRREPLAFNGSFWFDPDTLDLVQLEAFGDRLPVELNVDIAVIRTSYAHTPIGKSDALLPQHSELTVTYLDGKTYRDRIVYSGCHQFGSDSTIRFDTPVIH